MVPDGVETVPVALSIEPGGVVSVPVSDPIEGLTAEIVAEKGLHVPVEFGAYPGMYKFPPRRTGELYPVLSEGLIQSC